MNNFFLMTRGRTGSTAVADELNKSRGLCVMQELFLMRDFKNVLVLSEIHDLLLPFDLWKLQGCWWKRALPFIYSDKLQANRYLVEAEAIGQHQGAASFGFKVLSHHLDQRPFLTSLLKQRGYRAIYLTRNLVRQVLSGMVAKQRGIYNTTKNFEDSHRYHIDLDKFQQLVQWGKQRVEKDCTRLTEEGFSFAIVTYEDFLADRQSFFDKIFKFLGLPTELPPKSDYSIMIKDLRYTIVNYDAVVERATMMGMILDS